MPLNVNGALRLIYHVGKLVHYIIKCFTIKHLCIFRLEFTATKEVLESYNADTIILGTGSSPIVPPIKGIDGDNVYKANDILKGEKVLGNQKILVIGAGLVGCETAEFLSLYNNEVTIVDMIKEMVPLLDKTPRKHLLSRLEHSNVKFNGETKVLEFTPDVIKYECNGANGELKGFDYVVLAIGSRSYNPLLEVSEEICKEVYSIGDAKKAADAKIAMEMLQS